jgi:cation diffusion facilitator family transporter
VVLTVCQIAVGLFAHAQSLVADGMHTLSDLLGDFMVMFASRHGANPADERHPYGHGRYETAASMVLGLILAGVGAGFAHRRRALQSLDALPELHPAALWMALVTLAGKEGLFRYMLAVAQRLRSPMLVANAWHARADAASSLVVAVGSAGACSAIAFSSRWRRRWWAS